MTIEAILKDMEFTRRSVAQEAISIPSTSVGEFMSRVVPTISEHFSSFIAHFSPSADVIRLTSRQKDFLHLASKFHYSSMVGLPAFVPEGMKETYIEFANVLDPIVDQAVEVVDLMNEFSVYLARLVTNMDAKLSSENNIQKYLKLQSRRKMAYDSIGRCFKNGSTKSEVTYGDVVQRNTDWGHIFNINERMLRKLNGVDRKKLNAKVQEIADLLAKVVKSYKAGQLDGANPDVIRELADGSFQVASELEMFSIVYYRVLALTTAVNLTVEAVEKAYS